MFHQQKKLQKFTIGTYKKLCNKQYYTYHSIINSTRYIILLPTLICIYNYGITNDNEWSLLEYGFCGYFIFFY